ncbi:MAG: FAD-dependent monooxygenase [Pseudomonadota bacterium]
MDRQQSILVAGAGPVGLAAAVELARRGFAPTVIDNDGEPSPESRALAVNARTLDILEPAGVTERIIDAGHRVNGMTFIHRGAELMRLELSLIPHRFNFLISLPQSRTEEILIGRLRELGHDVGWYTALTGFQVAGDALQCLVDRNGSSEEVHADILIGADGASSLVRKTLGMAFDGRTEPGLFGLADVTLDDWPYPFDRAVVHRDPGQIVGFIPMGEGYGRLVSNHADVLNRLPPTMKVADVIWESEFRISYRQVEAYQSGNVFLAGDAAHIHSPAGGRGMNLGIEDAASLAWLIGEGRTEEYTQLRHPVGEKVLKFTEAQTRQMTGSSKLEDFMLTWLAPFLLGFKAVQRLAVTRLVGLETPHPPWLEPD